MSDSFTACEGIFKWASTIETRLRSDPTRAAFKEYVHVQGIQWLDEYLENVLAGPKEQPIIELAKTPGRKKDVPKKTRAATAAASAKKLKLAADVDKENVPVSTLQAALTKVQKNKDWDNQPQPATRKPLSVSIAEPFAAPLQESQAELSRIEETDEDTISRLPSPIKAGERLLQMPTSSTTPASIVKPISTPVVQQPKGEVASTSRVTVVEPVQPPPAASTLEAALAARPAVRRTVSVSRLTASTSTPAAPTSAPISARVPQAVTPVSPPRSTVPRSPKLHANHGSAPVLPSSPVTQLPELSTSADAVPPAPPVAVPGKTMRSSWLTRAIEGGMPNAAKKSMGTTLVAQAKKSLGVGLGTKRKSDVAELDGSDDKPIKVTKTAHPADAKAMAVSHKPSKHDDDSGDDMGDEEEMDEESLTIHKLKENVGKLKQAQRTKSNRYGVDVDVTGRFDHVVPQPPAPAPIPPTPAPPAPILAPAKKSSQAHERLSISDLSSSYHSVKSSQTQKTTEISTPAPGNDFMLLVESTKSKSTTTPPHSPPPSSVSAAAQKSKHPYEREQLTQFEEMVLGIQPSASKPVGVLTAAPVTINAIASAPQPLPKPVSPIAQKALASKPFTAAPTAPKATPANPWAIPDDLFKPQHQLQAPPLTRQASTQESFADSLFSQPMQSRASQDTVYTQAETQPEDEEPLPTPAPASTKAKGKNKVEVVIPMKAPVVAKAVTPVPKPDVEMEDPVLEPQMTPSTSGGIGSSILNAALGVIKGFGSAKKPAPSKPEHQKAFDAAAQAKKEQEEREKKAAKTKEIMEQRRLAASQRTKQVEPPKKDEIVQPKRKREEEKEKEKPKGIIPPGKTNSVSKNKSDDELSVKKQKISNAPVEKKPQELRKQPSKDKLNTSFTGTSNVPRTLARPASAQSNYAPQASSSRPGSALATYQPPAKPAAKKAAPTGPSFNKLPPAFQKSAPKATNADPVAGPSSSKSAQHQPAHQMREEMRARAQAQMEAQYRMEAKASEQIELPDIDSEYSNSDDEDRHKDVPDWARSPELIKQLEMQRAIDPDELFGEVPDIDMAAIFKGAKVNRFRVRSSSAHWTGTDALTEREKVEYKVKMGYTKEKQ